MELLRPILCALITAVLLCSGASLSAQEPSGPDAEEPAPPGEDEPEPDGDGSEAPVGEGEADEEDAEITGGETVLWDIRGDDAARLDAFRKGIVESLADRANRHLLSEVGFSEHVKRLAPGAPTCLLGVTDCVSPSATVFDALDLSSLVRVDVLAVGANYNVIDARGQSVRQGEVVESDARKLGFAVVRAIFDATGVITIDSKPQGATVELDGRSVGTTPLTYRVAIGEHRYRVRLPDREPIEGTVTVTSGKDVEVMHDLNLTPGTLLVQDAPDGAEIFIDGELAGKAGGPIPLAPGNYTMELKAAGFQPVSENITIEPGLVMKRSIPMLSEGVFGSDVSSDEIVFNNYILRFGFEAGLQNATFQDARSNDDIPYEFISFADSNGNLPGAGTTLNESLGTLGMRLDASYALRNFSIVAISASYLQRSVNFPGFVAQRAETPEPVTVTAVRRLQLRPFQLSYRLLFANFVPYVEGGIGINFSWLQAEGAQFEGAKTLRRTDALWTLALGGQYYFTPNFFAQARYSLQDYFEGGLGTDHQFSLGIGAAFPNVFGFDPEPPDKL